MAGRLERGKQKSPRNGIRSFKGFGEVGLGVLNKNDPKGIEKK